MKAILAHLGQIPHIINWAANIDVVPDEDVVLLVQIFKVLSGVFRFAWRIVAKIYW